MPEPDLDILVVSDLHCHAAGIASGPDPADSLPGPLLLRKALRRLRQDGVEPGLVILLGDLLADGAEAGAQDALIALAEGARGLELPLLAVPGNHDGDYRRFSELFDCRPGLHEIGGYGFLVFHDHAARGGAACRSEQGLGLPREAASAQPGLPLVALQHSTVAASIENDARYLLMNSEAAMSSYREAGVILSLSGHNHAGQTARRAGGTTCCAVPAATGPPFRFALVRLRGREVEMQEIALQLAVPGLVDLHCHTEYAYCGTSVSAEANTRVARAMGLAGLYLTEHAFQLYFDRETAWSWEWQTDPRVVRQCWESGRGRMPQYREFAREKRSNFVKVGLELDLLADGSLLLADEDKQGWDLIIGHIHRIPQLENGDTGQAEAERIFLRESERLLAGGIDVFAHPFRLFPRNDFECPAGLYGPVAELLAATNTAAELNFHYKTPNDPRFFEQCLSRGVKIALGTDAHALEEVGDLFPHLQVLRELGVRDTDLPQVLYRPA